MAKHKHKHKHTKKQTQTQTNALSFFPRLFLYSLLSQLSHFFFFFVLSCLILLSSSSSSSSRLIDWTGLIELLCKFFLLIRLIFLSLTLILILFLILLLLPLLLFCLFQAKKLGWRAAVRSCPVRARCHRSTPIRRFCREARPATTIGLLAVTSECLQSFLSCILSSVLGLPSRKEPSEWFLGVLPSHSSSRNTFNSHTIYFGFIFYSVCVKGVPHRNWLSVKCCES